MAYALDLAFDIPPAWGYSHLRAGGDSAGDARVTAISRLQTLTQPLWLVMLVVPYIYVLAREPRRARGIDGLRRPGWPRHAVRPQPLRRGGHRWRGADHPDGRAGRLPALHAGAHGMRRGRWLAGCSSADLAGWCWGAQDARRALLAWLAIRNSVPVDRAVDPNQMYLVAWEYVFPNLGWAIAATALFVLVSQLKINVTNAYAGSLAWSNFFARLTHSHPGRVVWVVFNTLIALMLMELDVFQALGKVLGLYSNIAISWMMAVVADLVINKPLGLSPPGIEFKRAHLYDINPVGWGNGHRLGAFGGGLFRCLRRGGAVVLGADRAAHRLRGLAVDRLGDRALLHRASVRARAGCSAA